MAIPEAYAATTILLAEDEPTTRNLLTRYLRNAGFEVWPVEDGEKALETLENGTPIDLVITDMRMPRVDGRELIRRIKEDPAHKDLPVIIVSGVIGFREVEDLVNLGMARFLSKPVNADKLRDCVLQLMRFRQPQH